MCTLQEVKERVGEIPRCLQPVVAVVEDEKVRRHSEIGVLAGKKVRVTHIFFDESRGIICVVKRKNLERAIYSKFLKGLNVEKLKKIVCCF